MKLQERLIKAEELKNEYYDLIKKLPELNGSEKQVTWATNIRNNYVRLVNGFVDYKFNKKKLTRIIVNLAVTNYLLKNVKDSKFYINNRDLLNCDWTALAEHFAFTMIGKPENFESAIDYLVNCVREGMTIKDIKQQLEQIKKENC